MLLLFKTTYVHFFLLYVVHFLPLEWEMRLVIKCLWEQRHCLFCALFPISRVDLAHRHILWDDGEDELKCTHYFLEENKCTWKKQTDNFTGNGNRSQSLCSTRLSATHKTQALDPFTCIGSFPCQGKGLAIFS